MADTGLGATLAFGTSSWTGQQFLTITPGEITRAPLETTHLGTTGTRTFAPEELLNSGTFTAEFFYDPNLPPPYSAAAETITITYPIPSGGTTGATLAGSGFITGFTAGQLAIGEFMRGSLTVTWAGALTFTDST